MKSFREYLLQEADNDKMKDLENEINLALKPLKLNDNFTMAKIKDIEDIMYKMEFDYDEERSEDDTLVFSGEYIDKKYDVIFYADEHRKDEFKIKNFQIFEA